MENTACGNAWSSHGKQLGCIYGIGSLSLTSVISCSTRTTDNCHYYYHHSYFLVSALPQELTHDVANAWLFSHGFLLGLTKHHPIAKLVVENGLLPHIIDELQRLRLTEVNWVCIIHNILICSCRALARLYGRGVMKVFWFLVHAVRMHALVQ